MRIITVLGSPRKNGNSSAIAKAFTDKARSLGADVSTYYLNGMNFRGCQGCMSCKEKSERCVLTDDLTELLDAIHEADAVVMASPVYYHGVSGQFKTFFDRTFSFVKPDFFTRPDPTRLPPGKKALLILSQGQGEDAYKHIVEQHEYFLSGYGFEERRFIRAVHLSASSGDEDRRAYLKEAEALAKEWCSQ